MKSGASILMAFMVCGKYEVGSRSFHMPPKDVKKLCLNNGAQKSFAFIKEAQLMTNGELGRRGRHCEERENSDFGAERGWA